MYQQAFLYMPQTIHHSKTSDMILLQSCKEYLSDTVFHKIKQQFHYL